MNVTLKVPDDVLKEARHMAVDADMSLSKWMTDLIIREAKKGKMEDQSVLEALACPELSKYEEEHEVDFEFERVNWEPREIEF